MEHYKPLYKSFSVIILEHGEQAFQETIVSVQKHHIDALLMVLLTFRTFGAVCLIFTGHLETMAVTP